MQQENQSNGLSGKQGDTHKPRPATGATDLPAGTPAVKNAHASGDGSYGRNDESLPDETGGTMPPKDNTY